MELLLTLEEFCSEEGVFEGSQEGGRHFAAIFEKVLFTILHLSCSMAPSPASVFAGALTYCHDPNEGLTCYILTRAGPDDAV